MFALLQRQPSGSKPPNPAELVRATHEAMTQLEAAKSSGAETPAKASEEVSRSLSAMKLLLYGEPDKRPNPETAAELAREVWKSELLRLLLTHLPLLDFECRKDVSQVFSNLLRRQQHGEHETVKWLEENRDVLFALLRGYETPQLALNYGIMLRECARHERLAQVLLPSAEHQEFYELFMYVESPYFDVASDAFASLKDLLTKHKPVVAAFLAQHYEAFFQHYHKLVCSDNYVTKRQSLKLLGELLLDRTNFAIMTRYIACADNLKMVMVLLRDRSSSIQFEAFHVFKIFVANPHKEGRVRNVLLRNQAKLLEFMASFQSERADEQFVEEKQFLINEISNLQPAPAGGDAGVGGEAAAAGGGTAAGGEEAVGGGEAAEGGDAGAETAERVPAESDEAASR